MYQKIASSNQKSPHRLKKIFPGVRSLMIMGMWQHQQEPWFGASVVLSYSPTRFFSYHGELSFVAAFCGTALSAVLMDVLYTIVVVMPIPAGHCAIRLLF